MLNYSILLIAYGLWNNWTVAFRFEHLDIWKNSVALYKEAEILVRKITMLKIIQYSLFISILLKKHSPDLIRRRNFSVRRVRNIFFHLVAIRDLNLC